MARARLISASLGSSRRFCRLPNAAGPLSEFAQLLFMLIVVNCDDFGRAEADPFTVKLKVFPGSSRKEQEFQAALDALAEVGLIRLYSDGEDAFLVVEKFEDHQSGLHKRTKSHFPEPPLTGAKKDTSGNSRNLPELPASCARAESNLKGIEEKGIESEEKGERAHVAGAEPLVYPAGLIEEMPVRMYFRTFRPERLPAIGVQERIALTVGEDIGGWQRTLTYWETNGYRPESIGKMLEHYQEQLNGGRNGDRRNDTPRGDSGPASGTNRESSVKKPTPVI